MTVNLPNRLLRRIPDWTELSECRTLDHEDGFFLEPYAPEAPERIKVICRRCRVRGECLEWALERPGETIDVVYGGLTSEQRRLLGRERSQVYCPGCRSSEVAEVPRGEVCLACGVSWLT